MQMIEHKLFPTLVGEFEDVIFPEQCDDIIFNIDTNNLKAHGALTGDSGTTINSYFNFVNNLPENLSSLLMMKIQICLDEYTTKFGCCKMQVENAWVSFQYPYSKLKTHKHPGSEISGVLYLKADEKSSPIYFDNPNPFSSFITVDSSNNREFLCTSTKFKPKTGTMLLFPSWLSHGSGDEENMSEERIILSFNTKSV